MLNSHKICDPLVSIIIPVYNRAQLLSRAIRSVLNQVFQNFEVIVVDDGSTDDIENVVKSFNDKRIRYIRHEERRGAPAARNTGIRLARGKYIAFQDSDDEWHPEKLEKQMRAFENAPPDLGVVYTSFWRVENGRKNYIPPSNFKQKEGYIHGILLETNFISTPTAIVKKECFEKAGMFDESLPRLQEWELWIRISKYYRFKHIDEPLVNAYLQPDSISRNMNAWIMARKLILEKHFEEISKKPALLGKHYYEIGTLLCLNGEIEEGKSYFIKAIRAYPFNMKLLFSTFFSFLGEKAYSKVAKIYLDIKTR